MIITPTTTQNWKKKPLMDNVKSWNESMVFSSTNFIVFNHKNETCKFD